VTLQSLLNFTGNLVLTGELHITSKMTGPCLTVHGDLQLANAHASFLGCQNK
ncbi:pmpB, partial [Symbiodinium pilosum]